jgi:hypothetical protein
MELRKLSVWKVIKYLLLSKLSTNNKQIFLTTCSELRQLLFDNVSVKKQALSQEEKDSWCAGSYSSSSYNLYSYYSRS